MKTSSPDHGEPNQDPAFESLSGSLTRRELLRVVPGLGLATLAPGVLVGCGSDEEPLGPENLFQHGVASGDPQPDGVILWTRVTPQGSTLVIVTWEIADRPRPQQEIVASGVTLETAERDFTVKIDARELDAGTHLLLPASGTGGRRQLVAPVPRLGAVTRGPVRRGLVFELRPGLFSRLPRAGASAPISTRRFTSATTSTSPVLDSSGTTAPSSHRAR